MEKTPLESYADPYLVPRSVSDSGALRVGIVFFAEKRSEKALK